MRIEAVGSIGLPTRRAILLQFLFDKMFVIRQRSRQRAFGDDLSDEIRSMVAQLGIVLTGGGAPLGRLDVGQK